MNEIKFVAGKPTLTEVASILPMLVTLNWKMLEFPLIILEFTDGGLTTKLGRICAILHEVHRHIQCRPFSVVSSLIGNTASNAPVVSMFIFISMLSPGCSMLTERAPFSCTCHRRRNRGGGTRGTCPPLVRICFLVPPFKLSGTVTFLSIPRRWNTYSDGSAIPEHGERRSKNTRAQYSSGIESKYKFEYKYDLRSDLRAPNFKNFSGGPCPQTPLVRACLCMHHHRYPPNCKYLPPPMPCTRKPTMFPKTGVALKLFKAAGLSLITMVAL